MAAITPAMTMRNVKPIAVGNIMSTVSYSSLSSLHRMQILASFEPPKFGSEGGGRLWPRSRTGARPRQAAAQHEHAMILTENRERAPAPGRAGLLPCNRATRQEGTDEKGADRPRQATDDLRRAVHGRQHKPHRQDLRDTQEHLAPARQPGRQRP